MYIDVNYTIPIDTVIRLIWDRSVSDWHFDMGQISVVPVSINI